MFSGKRKVFLTALIFFMAFPPALLPASAPDKAASSREDEGLDKFLEVGAQEASESKASVEKLEELSALLEEAGPRKIAVLSEEPRKKAPEAEAGAAQAPLAAKESE